MRRVALQHGAGVGRHEAQATDQLALDNGQWRQFGVAHHTLSAQQRVVYAGAWDGIDQTVKYDQRIWTNIRKENT